MTTQIKSKLDQASTPFFVTDPAGIIRYANSAITYRTGFDVPEAVGKRPGDLWGGQMDRKYYVKLWQTIKHERMPATNEVHNISKGGKIYADASYAFPVTDAKGSIQYFVGLYPQHGHETGLRLRFTDRILKSPTPQSLLAILGIHHPVSPSKTLTGFIQKEIISPTDELFERRSDDAALIRSAQQNPEYFTALYQKYKGPVFDYFAHRVEHEPIARDLVQETFRKAFTALPNFEVRNASYLTYLLRIAHNLLVNHYRSQEQLTEPFHEGFDIPAPSNINTDLRDIWQSVTMLNETEQVIFRYFYHEGLSIKEIGARLTMSENAVKLHLSRSRKKLRKELE